MKMLSVIKKFIVKAVDQVSSIAGTVFKMKKIKSKLIIAFLVPIIFIVLQGGITFINTSKSATGNAIQSSVIAMENSGKYLGVVLQTVENLSGQLLANGDVQNYLSGKYDKESILEKRDISTKVQNNLSSTGMFSPEVESIMLIPADKSIYPVTSKTPTNVYLDQLEESEMFLGLKELKGKGAWFGVHKELDELNKVDKNTYSLSYVRLVPNVMTMEIIGLLVIDVRMSVINDLTTGIQLDDSQQIHFITPDGRVITNGIDQTESTTITQQDFYKNLIASDEITGNEIIKFEGVEYLMTFNKIGSTGNMLVGLVPYSSLTRSARTVVISTVLFVIMAAVIAFGTGIIISNSMSRTINRIIKASGQAASGDLTVTLKSRRTDELGTLTRSISSMISNMRTLIERTIVVSEKVAKSAVTVSTTSQQVSEVSQEISRAIQEISQGASTQASDAEQGVEKISILAENINYVTENAKSIDNLTQALCPKLEMDWPLLKILISRLAGPPPFPDK